MTMKASGVRAMIAPLGLAAGHTLGRYELLIAVAQGGMGTVWAARGPTGASGSKIVAVKTMLPALSSDPRCVRMFLTESRIASRIQHPNVCAILDQGEQGGVLYFAMEWIDGDSLVALLGGSATRGHREPLPLPIAVRIGIDAARGLHAAHELRDDKGDLVGLVHRDVSPHNILLTRDGTVKIADFGVAKAMAKVDNPTTKTGHMKGKIHFMAPEQVCAENLDRRTDVFALGIVLYQLTTGIHPFAAHNDLATMARIARPEPVETPRSRISGYPPELEAAVMRALAKNPDDRFQTMAELAVVLEAVQEQLGGRREDFVVYIRNTLAPRIARRTAMIQEALLAAQESTLSAPPAPPPPRRGRKIAGAAALLSTGALIGAASLVWLDAGRTKAVPVAPSPSASTPGLEHYVITGEEHVKAPLSRKPTPSASAGGSAAPVRPPAEAGRAKFRYPGF
jgi:serine/threonine protein kinase